MRSQASRFGARGVTLIETVISSMLIALVLAGTLSIVGPIVGSTHVASDKLRATRLAAELTDEILSHAYEEPVGSSKALGVDSGESGDDRSSFDDVDDFHGWKSSPPQFGDGTPHERASQWTRTVQVVRAQIGSSVDESTSETGFKMVVVEVYRGSVLLCSMESIVQGDSGNAAKGLDVAEAILNAVRGGG